jgi:two-component system, cell cycle sensor histidine kinase and response regulator CckA
VLHFRGADSGQRYSARSCLADLLPHGVGKHERIFCSKARASMTGTKNNSVTRHAVRPTILVVDDELHLRGFVCRLLANYSILEAGTAAEAVFTSRNHAGPIALLLVDLVLPDQNGYQLAKHLQCDRPELKVIHMSGLVDHHGPNVLSKPFKASELITLVRRTIFGSVYPNAEECELSSC